MTLTLVAILGVLVRDVAAWVLIMAGVDKARDPQPLSLALRRKLPFAGQFSVRLLGVSEVTVGSSLILLYSSFWPPIVASGMFAAFFAARRYVLPNDSPCGCGGIMPRRSDLHALVVLTLAAATAVAPTLWIWGDEASSFGVAEYVILAAIPLPFLTVLSGVGTLRTLRASRLVIDNTVFKESRQ